MQSLDLHSVSVGYNCALLRCRAELAALNASLQTKLDQLRREIAVCKAELIAHLRALDAITNQEARDHVVKLN